MKTLNEIPGRNPFKVPDNYFEKVNAKIIERSSIPEPETQKHGLYRRIRPIIAVAASVTLLIALTFTAIKISSPDSRIRNISGITIEEFTESYLEELDLLVLEENTDPLTLSSNMSDFSNTEIIDYLMFENISANEIYEIL
jgi:hypothetical protein